MIAPVICRACCRSRAIEAAIVVWDRARPWRRWWVCRPDGASPCFRVAVGSAARHGIALATDGGPDLGGSVPPGGRP